jgi:hypothetical protein
MAQYSSSLPTNTPSATDVNDALHICSGSAVKWPQGDPCSLRVMHQALQEFARGCKCPLFKGISLLCLAACCTVLRYEWCQQWCQKSVSTRRRFPLEQTCDYCSIIPFAEGLGRCVLQSSQSLDPTGMSIPYLNRQLLQVTLRQDTPRIDEESCISMNDENSQPLCNNQELEAK